MQELNLSDFTDYELRKSLRATRMERDGIPLTAVAYAISQEFSKAELEVLIKELNNYVIRKNN